MCAHVSPDRSNAKDMSRQASLMLQNSLQLAKRSERIAEWLFNESGSSEGKDGKYKQVASFHNCLGLHVEQRYTYIHATKNVVDEGDDKSERNIMLMIPTQRIDGIAVGYTLTGGNGLHERGVFNESNTTSIGRFAFDNEGKHVICIREGNESKCTVLYVVNRECEKRRESVLLCIPRKAYGFTKLPSIVLGFSAKKEVSLDVEKTSEKLGIEGSWNDGDVDTLHPNLLDDLIGEEKADVDEKVECLGKKHSRAGRDTKRREGTEEVGSREETGGITWVSECLENLSKMLDGQFRSVEENR